MQERWNADMKVVIVGGVASSVSPASHAPTPKIRPTDITSP